MTVERLTVTARDNHPLAATLYGTAGPVVVVNPGVAIPASFYRHVAAWLADAGFRVLTYDIRGIGGSRPERLRGFEATLLDWPELDLAGIVTHAEQLGPVHLLGHSMGGQIAGLLPDPTPIRSMVTVSAGLGTWRLNARGHRLSVAAYGWALIPVTTALVGYTPLSAIRFGADLPAAMGRQWARWIRSPEYLFGDPSLPLERYESFTAPVAGWSVDGDPWGPPRSVDEMTAHYPNAERHHCTSVHGHLAAFKPGAEPLWARLAEWYRGHEDG